MPVYEQNKAASKLCLRLAATHGTCGFVNRRPFANHNNIYALLSFKIEYT